MVVLGDYICTFFWMWWVAICCDCGGWGVIVAERG